MTGPQRLSGVIKVGRPPAEALRLFTPRGERDWAAGWEPAFPAVTPDDTEPGTVFETSAHGAQPTVWVVTDRQPGQRISYAQVTPGDRAGTVSGDLSPAADGQSSEVKVTYELTALTGSAHDRLREFADDYPAYLQAWQDAISACLRSSPSRSG